MDISNRRAGANDYQPETSRIREETRGLEILDKRRETLVTRERALIESLTEFLTGFGAPSGDIELLRQTLSDMGDPFLLVTVGEFNAGKSALVTLSSATRWLKRVHCRLWLRQRYSGTAMIFTRPRPLRV